MNKYQEALDNLKEPTDAWSSSQLQMAENFEEPIVYKHQEDIDTLQELVDKSKPKRIEIWNGQYSCPNCKKLFFPITSIGFPKKFCDDCGQALDWSDDDMEPDDVDEQSAKDSVRELEVLIKDAINYGHSDIYLEVESAKRILYFIKKNIGEE